MKRRALGDLEDHALCDLRERCLGRIELLVVQVLRVEVHEQLGLGARRVLRCGSDVATHRPPELVEPPEPLRRVQNVGRVLHQRLVRAQERLVAEHVTLLPRHDGLVRHPHESQAPREAHVERGALAEAPLRHARQLEGEALELGHVVEPRGSQHRLAELVRRDRLRQVAKGPIFDGGDRRREARLARHEDHGHVDVVRANRLEKLEAGHLGHRDVAHDDVERAVLHALASLFAVRRGGDQDAAADERPLERAKDRRIVVHEQEANGILSVSEHSYFLSWPRFASSTSRSLRRRPSGVKGFCRNATPGSRTRWRTIASSV